MPSQSFGGSKKHVMILLAAIMITLNFRPKDDIIVFADKQRIYQVIHNILNNAIKYVDEGEITIETALQEREETSADNGHIRRQLVVSVQDSGPGIDPEIMLKLFTRFTTGSEKGTGLGLFISKSIVEAHGGRVWAENNEKGAVFRFTLPLVANENIS